MNLNNYDQIHIENLEVFANHGVFPEENVLGQKFVLSITLYCKTYEAGKGDDLDKSTHYGQVSQYAYNFMKENTYKLIEAAAENLAEGILNNFPLVEGVTIELKKPWAPIGLPVDYASVKITRAWHTACIALGSNMGDSKGYLDEAVEKLNRETNCKVEKVADYIITEPYGGVEQDDFVNSALVMKTLLSPEDLLRLLNKIEAEADRKRIIRWGPRTLDLDILLYDDQVISTEKLCVPHIEMHMRSFVLEPLAQIAPYMRHPILGKTVAQMLKDLEEK